MYLSKVYGVVRVGNIIILDMCIAYQPAIRLDIQTPYASA